MKYNLINGINKIYRSLEKIETLGDYGANLSIVINLDDEKEIKNIIKNIEYNLGSFWGTYIICTTNTGINIQRENIKVCSPNDLLLNEITTRWALIIKYNCELQFNFISICNEIMQKQNSHFINLPTSDANYKMTYLDYNLERINNDNKATIFSQLKEIEETDYFSQNFKNKNELNSPFYILDVSLIKEKKGQTLLSDFDINYFLYENNYKCSTVNSIVFKLDLQNEYFSKKAVKSIYLNNLKEKYLNTEGTKPKIALIVDIEGWAFWNIASQIKKRLSDFFEIEIITRGSINNLVSLIFYIQKFDLIHFFWRGELLYLSDDNLETYINKFGINKDYFFEKYINNLYITTSVYDHLFISAEEKEMVNKMLKYAKKYTVSSKRLYNIYKNNKYDKLPSATITDGVDLEMFYPQRLERFTENREELIIGWVGNSAWNNKEEDMKGVNTILRPVIKSLQQKGYKIKEYFADRQIRMIAHEYMKDYYSKIDVLVCSSKIEGTPNPILEAMACGVPCISTDVGIVPEVFGKKQQKFIMKERNQKELEKLIIQIYKSRKKILKELSEENIESIKNWTWEVKTNEFKDFFEECLKEKKHYEKD